MSTPPEGVCANCGAVAAADQEYCLECGEPVATGAGQPLWRSPLIVIGLVLVIGGGGVALAYDDLLGDSDREAAAPSPTSVAGATLPSPTVPPSPPTTPPATGAPPVATAPPPLPGAGGGSGSGPSTPRGSDEELLPPPSSDRDNGSRAGGGRPGRSGAPGSTGGDAGSGGIASWPSDRSAWTIILASAATREAARKAAERALDQGLEAGVLRSDDFSSLKAGFYVAFSGSYESRAQANTALRRVHSSGFPSAYSRFVKP